MTDKKIQAQKVMDAFRKVLDKSVYYDEDFVISILYEVIDQFSSSLPPDPNMDEFYARMYGGESVIYVDDILNFIKELKDD